MWGAVLVITRLMIRLRHPSMELIVTDVAPCLELKRWVNHLDKIHIFFLFLSSIILHEKKRNRNLSFTSLIHKALPYTGRLHHSRWRRRRRKTTKNRQEVERLPPPSTPISYDSIFFLLPLIGNYIYIIIFLVLFRYAHFFFRVFFCSPRLWAHHCWLYQELPKDFPR